MASKKKIQSFEDLKIWQKARDLRIKISNLSKDLPKEEHYQLNDQLIRASRSVAANIAEGYGRFHYQEYIQYCRKARGSLYEILDHLICPKDQGYINDSKMSEFRQDIRNCIQLLNGFISYLKKAKSSGSVQESNIDYNINPTNE